MTACVIGIIVGAVRAQRGLQAVEQVDIGIPAFGVILGEAGASVVLSATTDVSPEVLPGSHLLSPLPKLVMPLSSSPDFGVLRWEYQRREPVVVTLSIFFRGIGVGVADVRRLRIRESGLIFLLRHFGGVDFIRFHFLNKHHSYKEFSFT